MNIGIVVHSYDPSEGTGGYTTELVPRIAEQHDVTLYAARVAAPLPDNVTLVRVPAIMTTAYTAILSFPLAFRRVRKSHDLVHAQGWVTGSADIVTAHFVLAAWRRVARHQTARSGWGERLLGGIVEQREAALFRRGCRQIIAPSRRVRDDLERFYRPTAQINVVHHGFTEPPPDVSREAARRRFALGAEELVALWVGDTRKGLGTAIEAVAKTPEARLLVATRSPRESHLAHADRLGCLSRIRWAGYLENAWPAYAAADLLLYPTVYDAFGLVVAEAMACGVPPIVPKTAGIAELIEHRRSGWLLDAPTVPEARYALQALAAEPELRARVAAGARETARARSWDRVAEETLDVYEAAAAR
ncbi:MAG: glycosyltransferase family 4 protein [Gemmatimonadales bacterium]